MARKAGFTTRAVAGDSRAIRRPSIPVSTFGALAVLMFAIAGMWAWSSYRFLGRALRAPGEVVRIVIEYSPRTDRQGKSTGPSYRPVVRFTTAGEKTVEFTGLGAGEPDYEVGDVVTVFYLPDRPEKGKIASFQELWLGPVVLCVMGAIFGGVAMLLAKLEF